MLEEQLKGVMVEDCFVLSWEVVDGALSIEIEASLWPGHPIYSPPKPNEWTCYMPATLLFSRVSQLKGLNSMAEVSPIPGSEDPPDYGTLDYIEENDNFFKIGGPLGELSFRAENAQLLFKQA